MIASLRGRLIAKDTERAVVECHGVGYGVSMSITSLGRIGAEGSDVSLFVYTHVGQDVLRLYGFVDADERSAFETLIATSGVGPKLALAILSGLTPDELADAVASSDRLAFTRIPGIGKKTAERLLLELKDRLPRGKVIAGGFARKSVEDDLVSALLNLGFTQAVAADAARHATTELAGVEDLSLLVREALRSTTRGYGHG